jgi:hypothetical protein
VAVEAHQAWEQFDHMELDLVRVLVDSSELFRFSAFESSSK